MRILVLSKNIGIYSTGRLAEAARSRGHAVRVVDPLKFNIATVEGKFTVTHKGNPVKLPDAVIPRISGTVNSFGMAVVKQFELLKTTVLNAASAIALARDKFMSAQYLADAGIDVPATAMIRNPEDIDTALEWVGGPPVILKLIEGAQGIGVILAQSRDTIESTINAFFSLGQNIIIQQFVSESKGKDIRVLVVGDRVVASMRRVARSGEFRTNIHRGGQAERIELPESYASMAKRAVGIIGLDIAGVDIIESADGPKVLEINPSPGIEALEKVNGMDIATEIIKYVEDRAAAAG
ncbi:MAG: RimK family alpha-L-glutamate ligase [Deltaproteobacteria bacterium]|nr:RimK family alpha-L-glutamate ligase [Deltaproteobacteria bacterium]